ncbi:MAG: SAM-dependent methyltransferase [Sphingobacteriaceae bacterium]|nr:SAM-dependent methyltransferase [Sphingobacteriaceae bacterium]
MKAFWDERYAAADYVYGEQPNVWFAEKLAPLEAGRMLLPCEGEGRNAVFAARLGWEVVAFDQSEEGRHKAMALAARHQQQISYELADALIFTNPQPFDAVALVFAHMPEPLRAAFHQRMADLLKPGGTLILEGFHTTQLGRSSGGPRELSMLFTPEMLKADFPDFTVQQLEVATVQLNEGPFHQGEAVVVRLLARKNAD